MKLYTILSIFLLAIVSVCGNDISFGSPGEVKRRASAHLPRFSKKNKGYGSGIEVVYVYESYYDLKKDKKYKSSKKKKGSKKDKKYGKKGKKYGYYWEESYYDTRVPTTNPTLSPVNHASDVPSSAGHSNSEDFQPNSSNSEDCPRKYKIITKGLLYLKTPSFSSTNTLR